MKRKSEKSKGDYDWEDRITALPDDLLSMIVHPLPIKEAAAASILSKRWKHIWKSTTNLNFFDEGYHRYLQLQRRPENHQISERYVNSVNREVEQHSNPTIKRFRACCIVDPGFEVDILNWIQFVMNKKVEILELEFYSPIQVISIIPKELLSHQSCEGIGFKFLKVLHFRCVDVTGEVLEYFMSNCAALVRLTVNAAHLVNLRVVGPSIALKHLALINCPLQRFEVRDAKLVSFHLSGMAAGNMSFTNVPFLVELSYMCSLRWRVLDLLITGPSFCISQLEILRLDISGGEYRPNYVIPILSNSSI